MGEKVINKGKVNAQMHVRVAKPGNVRRNLLSLAIDLVQMQKKHRDFLNRRTEKEELLKRLRKTFNEIKELMKLMDSYELPLSLEEVESLPRYKKEKEEIEKIEKYRELAEEDMKEEERKLKQATSKKPHSVPKAAIEAKEKTLAMQRPARKPVEERKPVDKLEADIEALRRRLESI